MKRRAAALVVALGACRPSASTTGALPSASASTSAEPTATVPPAMATEPAPSPTEPRGPKGAALPMLADAKTLSIRQAQGGPSQIRCDGVAYEITLDLATSAWTQGLCLADGSGAAIAHAPLKIRKGKLTPAQRDQVDDVWSRMRALPAPGCGNDGGPLTLTLTKSDGTTESWVDQNWGCKKPPPLVATALKDFANALNVLVMR